VVAGVLFAVSLVLLQGIHAPNGMVFACLLLLLASLALPRLTGTMGPTVAVLAVVPGVVPAFISSFAYGPRTPVLFVYFALPIVGMLLGGRVLAVWYVAAGVVGMGVLSGLDEVGYTFPFVLGDERYNLLLAVVYIVTLVLAGTTAWTYDVTLRNTLQQVRDALLGQSEARREAEAASVAKSRFLANMSHELRTPLNGILGYAELVREQLDDGERPDGADVDRIHAAGVHLLALIDDILDLARVEAGEMAIVSEPFRLGGVLDAVVAVTEPACKVQGNELVLDVDPSIDTVQGDERRLSQVLMNLLSNATKFTKNGVIRLEARSVAGMLELRVSDTGVGIARQNVPRLFRAFSQVHGEAPGTFGGTGLGLALSRTLTESMGGTIAIDSELGEGTTFTVRLPLGAPT